MRKSLNKLLTLWFIKLFSVEPFRSRAALLKGEAGIVTDKRPCGCVLTGEHQPDKHLWIFTLDYSHCQQMKEVIHNLTEVLP